MSINECSTTGDNGYAREYDLFVKGVSYAAEGEVPDFTTAIQAVRTLVQIISYSTTIN